MRDESLAVEVARPGANPGGPVDRAIPHPSALDQTPAECDTIPPTRPREPAGGLAGCQTGLMGTAFDQRHRQEEDCDLWSLKREVRDRSLARARHQSCCAAASGASSYSVVARMGALLSRRPGMRVDG